MGLQTKRELWRILQESWIASFLLPLYVRWLEAATLSGALEVPRADWRLYTSVRWVPRGWASVDPLKEVQASKEELTLGLASRQRILAEQSREFAIAVEELGQERDMAATAGVDISGWTATAGQPAPTGDPANAGDGVEDPTAGDGPPTRSSRIAALARAGLNGKTR